MGYYFSELPNYGLDSVNVQYAFDNGITLSIGAGGVFRSHPRGFSKRPPKEWRLSFDWETYEAVEVAFIRSGQFVQPKDIGLPQFQHLFTEAQPAKFVSVAEAKEIVWHCKVLFGY